MADVQVLSALARIPTDRIEPGPNARGDVGDVTELAASIKTIGMQKPLLVCPLPDDRYQVLDGHRRLAAAKQIGLAHVDAVLRRPADPALRIQQQLAMHTHAKAFDPIAEAKALHELMWQHNMTREQIAQAVGRSPLWVRDRIGLLQLTEGEQRSVAAGRMSISEAKMVVAGRRSLQSRDPDAHRAATQAGVTQSRTRTVVAHCVTCTCGGDR